MAAIAQDRLVALCGAGLSMAAPSSVPSACSLAAQCSARYQLETGQQVPADIAEDLERLSASFFLQPGLFRLFLTKLVDWSPFLGTHNSGHECIGDFLLSGGLDFAATTNVDELIERGARALGENDFQATIREDQVNDSLKHKQLLKLHGSASERLHTLWCREQLIGDRRDAMLAARLGTLANWLKARLIGRSVLIVGFFTDWEYLNAILFDTIKDVYPPLVVVVDLADEATLAQKAPDLWTWSQTPQIIFRHVQQSGAVFLEELRHIFSVRFMERLLDQAVVAYTQTTGEPTPPAVNFDVLDNKELYDLRRDACGTGPSLPVTSKMPCAAMTSTGLAHLLLLRGGAVLKGTRYELQDGRIVRVVNGAGETLPAVEARCGKDSALPQDDFTICASAFDVGGVPSDIVRGQQAPTVVRASSTGCWLTLEDARNWNIC